MLQATFKPIENWPKQPTPSYKRQASRFSAGWIETLDLLERELNHLKAKDVFLESRPLRRDSFRPSGGFTRFCYARRPLSVLSAG